MKLSGRAESRGDEHLRTVVAHVQRCGAAGVDVAPDRRLELVGERWNSIAEQIRMPGDGLHAGNRAGLRRGGGTYEENRGK